jgi:hypothetical protein
LLLATSLIGVLLPVQLFRVSEDNKGEEADIAETKVKSILSSFLLTMPSLLSPIMSSTLISLSSAVDESTFLQDVSRLHPLYKEIIMSK